MAAKTIKLNNSNSAKNEKYWPEQIITDNLYTDNLYTVNFSYQKSMGLMMTSWNIKSKLIYTHTHTHIYIYIYIYINVYIYIYIYIIYIKNIFQE